MAIWISITLSMFTALFSASLWALTLYLNLSYWAHIHVDEWMCFRSIYKNRNWVIVSQVLFQYLGKIFFNYHQILPRKYYVENNLKTLT